MIIRNIQTKTEYPLSKAKWDSLGKQQKLFTIINADDNHQVAQKVVSNLTKDEKTPVVEQNNNSNKNEKPKKDKNTNQE
jgi:hypothetical protein